MTACWACGRAEDHPQWCIEAEQQEDARQDELAKLIRSQQADMNRGGRQESQRFGPDRERVRSLTPFLEYGEDYHNEPFRQPWE